MCLHCFNLVYSLFIQGMDIAMSFEHLHEIARNSLKQQNLQKIKSNVSNLDDVLTFRVNSALKKEFSKICKDNQSSASSELKRYMLKIVEQGSL